MVASSGCIARAKGGGAPPFEPPLREGGVTPEFDPYLFDRGVLGSNDIGSIRTRAGFGAGFGAVAGGIGSAPPTSLVGVLKGGGVSPSPLPFYYKWVESSNLHHVANPDFDPEHFQRESRRLYTDGTGNPTSETIIGEISNDRSALQYQSLPHRDLPPTEIRTHNNMVPFFGSSLKQNVNPDNIQGARKLENFTGQFKNGRQQKLETEPLFAPVAQNLDGLVPLRDKDRFVPSNLGKRNNELPFTQETVGPGLNQGFTATPSGGFHNTVRIMPKDNDALNVNPRTTFEGRVVTGKNVVDKRTSQSLNYKYKPELLVTNFDGERNFVTTGAVINPASRPQVHVKPTARQQFTEVKGSAFANRYNTPENLISKSKPSDRQNFCNTPFRNASRVETKKGHFDSKYNYENRANERSVTGPRSIITNLKAVVNQVVASFTDQAKKTRKESYQEAERPSGHVGPTGASRQKGAVENRQDARTTIREQLENNSHHGALSGFKQLGPAYSQAQVQTTLKELLENNQYTGALTGLKRSRLLNNLDAARTTIRETNETNSHLGHSQPSHFKGVTPYLSQARTTGRELLETNSHVGGAKIGLKSTIAPIDQARTTVRETTANNDHTGYLALNNSQKGTSRPLSEARTTIRETTEHQSGGGGALTGGTRKLRVQPVDHARTTIREMTESQNHTGTLVGGTRKLRVQPVDQARTTVRETTESQNHTGTLLGGKQKLRVQPVDQARTTVRETTEIQNHTGTLYGTTRKLRVQPVDQARTTVRETTEGASQVLGAAKAGNKTTVPFIDNLRTTLKELLETASHAGQLTGYRKARNQVGDQARTTVRETTEASNHLGGVAGSQTKNKSTARVVDQMKTTTRETTENNDHLGGVGAGAGIGRIKNKLRNLDQARTTGREQIETNDHLRPAQVQTTKSTVQPPDQMKTTHRETTENHDYLGPIRHPNQADGDGYQITNFEDRPTQRQFSHQSYTGGAGPKGIAEQPQLYDSAYNARTNSNKEKIARGRTQQNGNLPLFSGKEHTNIQIKKLDSDRKRQHGLTRNPVNPGPRMPESLGRLTSFKNRLPEESSRLDTSLLEEFKKNPLTQSVLTDL